MKKEILFVGNYFSHARGTKPVMERVAQGLALEGFRITLTSKKSFWLWRAMDHAMAIFFKRYSLAFIDVFSDRSFLLAEWSALWLSVRRKKFILTLRGGKLAEFHEANKARVSRLFRHASLIQTPSLFLKEHFEKHGFVIAYMPNPIDLQKFTYTDRPVPKVYKVLWVRAFTKIYNPHIPVLVLKKLLESFPEATLTMIGPDQGLMKDTEELIVRLNLSERISIVGPVNNNALPEYYQTHSVYLNTTLYESFGVAVVEAASCGIPIVSFRVGEIPYLWSDEKNILLCQVGDVPEMTKQVERLFLNEQLSHSLSRNARKRAEDFSWENVKTRWLDLIRDKVN